MIEQPKLFNRRNPAITPRQHLSHPESTLFHPLCQSVPLIHKSVTRVQRTLFL